MFRLFGITLAVVALPHFVLAYVIGDRVQQMGMLLVMVACIPQAYFAPRLSRSTNEWVLHVFNICALAVAQTTMPDGFGGAPLLVAFALSSVTFSTRNLHAYIMMALGAVVVFVLPGSGASPQVPAVWSVLASLTVLGAHSITFVSQARAKAARAWARLEATELNLLAQEATLQQQHRDLSEANALLNADAQALARQLDLTAGATRALASKRVDEANLVQAMHHDLREPMRSIISFNQLIRRRLVREGSSATGLEYLSFSEEAGQRMVRMLDDLLTYTQVDQSEAAEAIDLNDLVVEVCANLQDLITRTEAVVEVGDLPRLQGIHTQLMQLFQNLLANALKFARPGVTPRIVVSCEQERSGACRVRVRDNGCGIPPDKLDSIFTLFDRGGRDQLSEGSGVGLALCKRIVTAHGGRIEASSYVGEGTYFDVWFPPQACGPEVEQSSASRRIASRKSTS